MKKIKILLLLLPFLASAADFNPSQYVNPNIGSNHSRWFFYTPAARPFGMAKLGASTNGTYGNEQGWEAVGYEDRHSSIDGFPCLHEFQVGGISIMPIVGEIKTVPGNLENPDSGFRSNFNKEDEIASPGFYSVILKDYDIKADLTATKRVGFQQFTFPASEESHIIFNIGNRQGESGAVRDAYIKHEGDVVMGYVITEPEYVKKYQNGATVPLYFYAVLDKTPVSSQIFHQGGNPVKGDEISGTGSMMSLDYNTKKGEKVTAKIGLSYTSIDNARINYEREAEKKNFNEVKEEAKNEWNDYLGRIEVKGGSEDDMTKFYTGLYHAMLGRGIANDVNGAFPKNDGTIGYIPLGENKEPLHNHYNTDAVWGAYWNLSTLWALAYKDYYADFISSQLLLYDDAGWLGDGIATSKYVSGVGTNMIPIIFAGAYNSGIRNFDIEKAYEAAKKNELVSENRIEGAGKMDVGKFVELGYVPFNDSIFFGTHPGGSTFSASHTLEYSFSSHAVSQWAKALGKEEDFKILKELSKGWEKIFDDDLKLIRPRDGNGNFLKNFDPTESWRGFQEGNAMQYTFFVPHNPKRLIEKIGKTEFNDRLDSIFIEARKTIFGGGKELNAFSGLTSPYNHGNQPSLHISWLFNFSGKPSRTQKWTRLICDEFYGVTGEHGYGYGQDEDQGQLGSWYVLAALGLFDVKGGTDQRPTFQIGSPLFDEIIIHQSSGKDFKIRTKGNSKDALYVQSATLNGIPHNDCWLYRDQIYEGGVLELQMSSTPSTWGCSNPIPCPVD